MITIYTSPNFKIEREIGLAGVYWLTDWDRQVFHQKMRLVFFAMLRDDEDVTDYDFEDDYYAIEVNRNIYVFEEVI